MREKDTVSCLHCGGEMKRTARACPHCGSDDQTGWSANTYLDEAGLPDDDDAYEEIREREFGSTCHKRPAVSLWIYVTAIMLLLLALLGFVKIAF